MGKRVTDLDKFALEEVWRPYQTRMGFDRRLEAIPMNLEKTARLLITDETGWSDLVLSRISACGFWFPDYINHPLADVVRAARATRSTLKQEDAT